MLQDDYQMFKIVVIGSMGTGKTNLSMRYTKNQYNDGQKSTVGVEFLTKIVNVRNQSVKVTLWDTAGQQRYKSLSKVYYKGASGILIVYDITDPQSYLDVQSWMRLANENLHLNEVVLMVVGNKSDLDDERKVPTSRPLKQYKQQFDIDCWEASAKTGYNVKQIFTELLQKIYQKNIQMKESALVDPSQFGNSIADPSSILAPVATKSPSRPQPIKEVILEQDGQQVKIPPKRDVKPQPKQKPNGTTVKLGQKGAKKKKKDSSCC